MWPLTSVLILLFSYSLIFAISVQARLVPKHYDLHLKLDPINKTLSGVVKCRIFVEDQTEIIKLSTDQSTVVNNITIFPYKAMNLTSVKVTNIERTKPNKLEIKLDQKLIKNGTYELNVIFEGIRAASTSQNNSFYVLNATNAENKTTWFYIIGFEKNSSKAVFPSFCIHEYGNYRTSFNLTVVRPKSFQVATVSSRNATHVNENEKDSVVSNYQTVPIRIRSFALIVTNASEIYTINKREYESCPPNKITYGINKDVVICALHHLTSFHGIPMAAENITVVVLPKALKVDIHAFGLETTTRSTEGNFTADPTDDLQFFISALSGQWWKHSTAGVHPSAEFLVYSFSWLAVADVFPKILKNSNASEYQDFINTLELVRYLLIKEEWNWSKNDSCHFVNRDVLTLNMIREILSAKLFTEALAGLFSKSNDSLIREEDIWKNLTNVARKNGIFDSPDFPQSIEEIVKPFLNRSNPAIPLLELDFEYSGSFGGFIRQTPFSLTKWAYDSRVFVNATESTVWEVPIRLVLENGNFVNQNKSIVWIKTQNRAVASTNFDQNQILLLNPDLRGPYIVNYRKSNWDRIFEKFDSIPVKYKIPLLHDIHVLAESAHYNYTEYIRYLSKIKPSKNNLPIWKHYTKIIADVDHTLSGNALNLTRKLFTKQLKTVFDKFLNGPQSTQTFWMKNLHDEIEKYLCLQGLPVCNRTAEFLVLMKNIHHPDRSPDLHSCASMQNITHEHWLQVFRNVTHFYKNYTYCDKKRAIKLLAGCTTNRESLMSFLDVVFKNETNPSYNFTEKVTSILKIMKTTTNGSSVLFNYFTNNWKGMIQKYPQYTNAIIGISTNYLKTQAEIEEAKKFLKSDEVQRIDAKKTIDDNLELLENQLNWNKTTLKEIEKLLTEAFDPSKKYFDY